MEAGQREGESSPTIWDMKRRLERAEEASQQKLQAYQERQQRQAQLVQRLQSKVRVGRQTMSPSPPSIAQNHQRDFPGNFPLTLIVQMGKQRHR